MENGNPSPEHRPLYDNGSSGNNNSLSMHETIGTSFLGLLCLWLLLALLRNHRYTMQLLAKQLDNQ